MKTKISINKCAVLFLIGKANKICSLIMRLYAFLRSKISSWYYIVIFFSLLATVIGHNALLHGLGSIKWNKENISSNIDNRIVGGTYASLGQFPYQV